MRPHMNIVSESSRDLGCVQLFSDLTEEERRGVARQCSWLRYTAGNQIVYHLDRGQSVFFIVAGAVRAVIHSLSGKQVSYRNNLAKNINKRAARGEGFPAEIVVPELKLSDEDQPERTFQLQQLECDDGWLTVEAFGQVLPGLAAATKIWRPLFHDAEELAAEALDFMKREWAAVA